MWLGEEMAGIAQPVALLLFDPLVSYLGSTKLNEAGPVRGVLHPLCNWAEEQDVCLIGLEHFNKDVKNLDALYRVSGSSAITEVARMVHFAIKDERSGRVTLACRKHNNCPEPLDLSYLLVETRDHIVRVADWQTETEKMDVGKHLSGALGRAAQPSEWRRAQGFVIDYVRERGEVRDGRHGVPSAQLQEAAEAAGFKKGTLYKAVAELGGETQRPSGEKNPPWWTWLPESAFSNTHLIEHEKDVIDVEDGGNELHESHESHGSHEEKPLESTAPVGLK
jgi:hypothetical protein